MKILVLIKQVPDTETKIDVTADQMGIVTDQIKYIVSPYDEFAVEAALRLKEQLGAGETVSILVGPKKGSEALRSTLAMGMDRSIHVVEESIDRWGAHVTAHALNTVIQNEKPDVVLCGKQGIDYDQGIMGQSVAALMEWPCAANINKLTYNAENKTFQVERELGAGAKEVIEITTPCVLTTDKGLNEPRYASLPNIMKAKKKEIKELTLNDLGLNAEKLAAEQKLKITAFILPPKKQAGRMLSGDERTQVQTLVKSLREDAKVI